MNSFLQKRIVFFVCLLIFGGSFCETAYGQAPAWLWSDNEKGTVTNGHNAAYSLALDAAGNVYMTGYFGSPTAVFKSSTLSNKGATGTTDMVLVKYDSSGNVLWAKGAGGTSNERAYYVAVDASDNVYVTGYFSTTAKFENITLTSAGTTDIFLAKYDSNGNLLWAKSAGGTSDDYGYAVATNAWGEVFVAGYYYNSIKFGTTTLTSRGGPDAFLAKYDSSGNALWAKGIGGNGQDVIYSIATDPTGNVVSVGYFNSGVIYFDTYSMVTSDYGDFFYAKYDRNGQLVWAKHSNGNIDDFALCTATDINGNIYMGGSDWSDSLVFPCCTLYNPNSNYNQESSILWIAKCDSTGRVLWAKSAGGDKCPPKGSGNDRYDMVNNISVDAAGNVYASGWFYSASITFDGITLKNSSGSNQYYDIFIVKFDNSGKALWARSAGGSSYDDIARGLKNDASGNVYLSGYFSSSSMTLGSTTLTNTGGGGTANIFIGKLGNINTSIENPDADNRYVVYPNPAFNMLSVQLPVSAKDVTFQIYDVFGKVVLTLSGASGNASTLNISSLSNGMYFLEIKATNNRQVTTFFKYGQE